MLPSILASEIREGTRRFLVSTYEASDAFFHRLMQRFVEREHALVEAPTAFGSGSAPARDKRTSWK